MLIFILFTPCRELSLSLQLQGVFLESSHFQTKPTELKFLKTSSSVKDILNFRISGYVEAKANRRDSRGDRTRTKRVEGVGALGQAMTGVRQQVV